MCSPKHKTVRFPLIKETKTYQTIVHTHTRLTKCVGFKKLLCSVAMHTCKVEIVSSDHRQSVCNLSLLLLIKWLVRKDSFALVERLISNLQCTDNANDDEMIGLRSVQRLCWPKTKDTDKNKDMGEWKALVCLLFRIFIWKQRQLFLSWID